MVREWEEGGKANCYDKWEADIQSRKVDGVEKW